MTTPQNNRPVTVSELLQEAEKDLKRILEGEGEVYLPLPEGWAEGMGDMQNDGYAFPATMPLSKAKKLAKEMVKQLREKGFLED